MKFSPLQRCGRFVTSVLLAPAMRTLPGIPALYTSLYLMGKHFSDREERSHLRALVRSNMNVADIGANVGFYTTLFARLVQPGGKVFAFEPDPFTRRILEKRTASLACVSTFAVALADRDEDLVLVCNPSNRANNMLEFSADRTLEGERIPVHTTTFDAWWASNGMPDIHMVKMDTEGAEMRILRGMERFVTTRPPQLIVLEFCPPLLRQAGEHPLTVLEWLDAKGYDICTMEAHDKLSPVRDPSAIVATYEESFTNLCAIRRNA